MSLLRFLLGDLGNACRTLARRPCGRGGASSRPFRNVQHAVHRGGHAIHPARGGDRRSLRYPHDGVRFRGRRRGDDRGESRRRYIGRGRALARARHQSREPRRAIVRRRRASLSAEAARRGARARCARAAPRGGLLEHRRRSHLRIRGPEHRPLAEDPRCAFSSIGRNISPAIR